MTTTSSHQNSEPDNQKSMTCLLAVVENADLDVAVLKEIRDIAARRLKEDLSVMNSPAVSEFELSSKTFGAALRELRIAKGLTQSKMAEITGIRQPDLCQMEKGVHWPMPETINKLAKALSVNGIEILGYKISKDHGD